MPSVYRSSVTVTCLKYPYRLREASAYDWITATRSPDMCLIFPGLIDDEDAEVMFEAQIACPDIRTRCVNVARVALGRESGREWHWTYNLIDEAWKSWPHVNGNLLRQGVNSSEVTLADWVDAAFSFLATLGSEQDQAAFDARLRRIPRDAQGSVVSVPRMSSRAELLAFAAD